MRRLALRIVAALLTGLTLFGTAAIAHPDAAHAAKDGGGFGWPSEPK